MSVMPVLYERVAGCNIAYSRTGTGYPLLLLHGFPQTHMAWHQVVPLLDKHFTLIIPDLPGYGDSTGPAPDEQHEAYSKRNIGNILVQFMQQLGFPKFGVAGHDRGGRVGYRMAFDHPQTVTRLAVLDIIPTGEMADRMTFDLALALPHWWLLAQPYPFPETLIIQQAEYYLKNTLDSWSGNKKSITEEAWQEYLRCFKNPSVIRAMCEDYRAGATVDVQYDRHNKDRGQRITCPVLVLYPTDFFAARFGNPVSVWEKWAVDVQGMAVESGHFLMEEIPGEVSKALDDFFS
ncbi:alpha/beta hydrolase [Paraflavitalea soli]|uniref:Alpha/beta hydrolase n=1 Tax=Paraflavitalea soli TaxID=2315862 RepID=A0A3B7MJ57_9BACT|nr:alpha/beta hydrolase [Paraflavitalea soli]AXY73086.1 alpha/beta hydrolase [Paraflavitalea soli]